MEYSRLEVIPGSPFPARRVPCRSSNMAIRYTGVPTISPPSSPSTARDDNRPTAEEIYHMINSRSQHSRHGHRVPALNFSDKNRSTIRHSNLPAVSPSPRDLTPHHGEMRSPISCQSPNTPMLPRSSSQMSRIGDKTNFPWNIPEYYKPTPALPEVHVYLDGEDCNNLVSPCSHCIHKWWLLSFLPCDFPLDKYIFIIVIDFHHWSWVSH